MGVKQIIAAYSHKVEEELEEGQVREQRQDVLEIAEFFYDTIQGEGVYMGTPAVFLRLKNCTLSCHWCDTAEVWRQGAEYTFEEIFRLIDMCGLIDRFMNGHHLVLTGGSPLLQQERLVDFFHAFFDRYGFIPFVEVENECVILPNAMMTRIVDCWNNSPKLSNSGNAMNKQYKPDVLKFMSELKNSWFKFVVNDPTDWEEIKMNFIDTLLIKKSQIILMPQGANRNELAINRELVLNMAVQHGVRYTTREHVVVWNKKTGV